MIECFKVLKDNLQDTTGLGIIIESKDINTVKILMLFYKKVLQKVEGIMS